MVTTVSATGCGTHTKFIHGVPGIPPSSRTRNTAQAATGQLEQVQPRRNANQRYRESQVASSPPGLISPDHSFTSTSSSDSDSSTDSDAEILYATVPSIARANRTSNGGPNPSGRQPLVRDPPVILDAASLGGRGTAHVGQKTNGCVQNVRFSHWHHLQGENLIWDAEEDDLRRMGAIDIGDSEQEDSEYAPTICDEEEIAVGASERLVKEQLNVQYITDDDLKDLYVDPEHETNSSAGGARASFASMKPSIPSVFRDQFGTFYRTFNPTPSPATIPEDVEAKATLTLKVRRAMAEQGDDFYDLSTSDLSTSSSSSSEAVFRGFSSRLGTSAPASFPVVLGGTARTPAHSYISPDIVSVIAREAMAAPTRSHTLNSNLRDGCPLAGRLLPLPRRRAAPLARKLNPLTVIVILSPTRRSASSSSVSCMGSVPPSS